MRTILLLLLFPSIAVADDWTRADTYREAAYVAISTVDWLQTRNIARNPDRRGEQNVFLGAHPSVQQVNRYFALATVAHIGLAYALPKDWRMGFQYVSIGVELSCVQSNKQAGISARF